MKNIIVSKKKDFDTSQRGEGFNVISMVSSSERISRTYLELKDGRDPSDSGKLISINDGFEALYTIIEGSAEFTLYNGEKEVVQLEKLESIHMRRGVKYEIKGTCIIELICIPPYSKEMFSFVEM